MTDSRERCIKRSAQSARKSAKFPSSPAGTVLFTAKTAIQGVKTAVGKKSLTGAVNVRFIEVKQASSGITQAGSNLLE
jgi:hypothetical protein